ncbi:hypothetical protein E3T19_04430 [Cryobacterium sp. TMT4-31]|nr:hypothetical protein E3T19_04430 [Cryobacterium sp. TMT4-31]
MDAAERWRVLRLHVEDQIPLAVLAPEAGLSDRTLQRWSQLYLPLPRAQRTLGIFLLAADQVPEIAPSVEAQSRERKHER